MSESITWAEFKASAAAWLGDSRAALPTSPVQIRIRRHVATALLIAECDGIPAGLVDWSHPGAQRLQLAQLEWDCLTEEERIEGEREFRASHGLCHADARLCSMLRAVGHLGRARGRR